MTSAGVWIVFCIVFASSSEILAQRSRGSRNNFYPTRSSTNVSPIRSIKSCNAKEWTCRDGSCINYNDLCDGQTDCPDGSDETFIACSKKECPTFLYRCAYGACADGDAKCNGKPDCADKSDELNKDCKKEGEDSFNTCGIFKFQCSDGQCTGINKVCDGTKDCKDGSDESLVECSERKCPEYSFRCAYGACVDGDFQCNGIDECADGSDEFPELCEKEDKPNLPNNEAGAITPVEDPSLEHCLLPEKKGCITKVIESIGLPKYLKPLSMVHHSCNGRSMCQYCIPDGSWSPLITCGRVCDKMEKSNIVCEYKNITVDCDIPLIGGSKMNVTRTLENKSKDLYTVFCRNGVWVKSKANTNTRW